MTEIESSIIFLPVSDIEKTVHFYHEILNLPIHQKQGDSLFIFDTGYGCLGFCQYDDKRRALSGLQGVCLSLNLKDNEDVFQKYEELKDRVRVYKELCQHEKYPVCSFFILDPDDYLVEFQKIV